MIKKILILFSVFLFTLISCTPKDKIIYNISVSTYGNTWVENIEKNNTIITKKGIIDWKDSEDRLNTYIKFNKLGKVSIAVVAKVTSGKSTIKFTFNGKDENVEISNTKFDTVYVGSFKIDKVGYKKLLMQGKSKTSESFAEIKEVLISTTILSKEIVFAKGDFYWGRRGPSVHLNYKIPTTNNIVYYYSELTVPVGSDPVGSYFMANGFGEGYFGMQVNSETERRILFSVWSPHKTDNPGSIPLEKRIKLLKKGKDVYAGKFGGEGSGGQSRLLYNWKAGNTYQFLLKGKPSKKNSTTYTAYFKPSDSEKWMLIASFRRPLTNTYLKRFHAFLENFITSMGQFTRKCNYANQWVCDVDGKWFEITEMKFSADATARKESRADYAGGSENGSFFLKNCGFFDETIKIGSKFTKEKTNKSPKIDFSKLP